MATLIAYATLVAAPWKNGGGSTRELAVSPPGAQLDNFDWRISVAAITADGAFSVFPGIDRSLLLLEGECVRLTLDGARTVLLDAANPMLWFPGEAQVDAQVSGATLDFNVMTRRSRCRHQLETLAAPCQLVRRSTSTLLFVAGDGPLLARGGRQAFTLGRHDALLLDADDAPHWQLDATDAASVFLVDLFT